MTTTTAPWSRRRALRGAAEIATAGLLASACRRQKSQAPTVLRIGIVPKSGSNPIFLASREGAETTARSLGQAHGIGIEILWRPPADETPQSQVDRLDDLVKEKVTAIAVSCADEKLIGAAIDSAVARGVEVMTFDSDAPLSRRFAFHGPNDTELGERIVAELAAALSARGKVAILAGRQDAPNLRQRTAGARGEVSRHPGLTLVGTFFHPETTEEAAAVVLRVSREHPDLRGWAMLGGWALATRTLLDELPSSISLVAVGGLPPQLEYVEAGRAPVLLAPAMFDWGKGAVETIVDRVHWKKVVPLRLPTEVSRITKESLPAWRQKLRSWKLLD